MKRTHYCGELNIRNKGESVLLNGWVQRSRDLGNLYFIQLRDREGIVQLVIDPERCTEETMQLFSEIKREYVLEVKGEVVPRNENINPDMKTGEIEVLVDEMTILNKAKLPPFHIEDDLNISENLRLKYRYLDLRRPFMNKIMRTRYKLIDTIRNFMRGKGFIEIETPFLIKSTPEGARDFVVPSRMHQGKFYALPQSPQLFKQLLMVSGFDKYFQIARCFRDEDARADRQTDFTQLDLEMSFVEQDDVLSLTEELFKVLFKEMKGVDIRIPFDRLTYDQAMDTYGSDKPERRYGMTLTDLTEIFKDCGFKVFSSAAASGGVIRAIVLKGKAEETTRKKISQYEDIAKKNGAKGLAWLRYTEGEINGGISKFIKDKKDALREALSLEDGDVVFFGADEKEKACNALGAVRLHLIGEFELIEDPDSFDMVWITDYPLFEKDEENGGYIAKHHLFSMPTPETIEYLEKEPEKVYGILYDLVINGSEIASGSIRVHDPELQKEIMKTIGMDDEEIDRKFGFLLDAFEYGAPPHGGIAPGIDRLLMIMERMDNLKDVIAFPKTNNQMCLLTGAPDELSAEQLEEIGISIKKSEK